MTRGSLHGGGLRWNSSERGGREGRVPGVGSCGRVDSLCCVSAMEASWEASESLGTTWAGSR